jgi:hypothetical protein
MVAQPESSTHEVLAGRIERVTYHNAENGFCVLRAKARGHRDVVTVVGHAATISAGEWITHGQESGGLPIVFSDYNAVSYDRVPLQDVRPREWHVDENETPILPLPPPGELQQDYKS